MKTKERVKINNSRRLLHLGFHNKEGAVKISKANLFMHELAKFLICWDILQEDQVFVTEAIFENKSRADVFNLNTCKAHEVILSETKNSIDAKKIKYPCDLEVHDAKKIVEQYLKHYLRDYKLVKVEVS